MEIITISKFTSNILKCNKLLISINKQLEESINNSIHVINWIINNQECINIQGNYKNIILFSSNRAIDLYIKAKRKINTVDDLSINTITNLKKLYKYSNIYYEYINDIKKNIESIMRENQHIKLIKPILKFLEYTIKIIYFVNFSLENINIYYKTKKIDNIYYGIRIAMNSHNKMIKLSKNICPFKKWDNSKNNIIIDILLSFIHNAKNKINHINLNITKNMYLEYIIKDKNNIEEYLYDECPSDLDKNIYFINNITKI